QTSQNSQKTAHQTIKSGGNCTRKQAITQEKSCCYEYFRGDEVDFIVRVGRHLTAIEVTSGRTREARAGMAAFAEAFKPARALLVGGDGTAVDEFLAQPVEHWVAH
ncbi:hypothetical protein, partial [Tepidimonas aquatica]